MRKKSEARQALVYDFIVSYYRNHGYGPSLREVQDETGISLGLVHWYVDQLVQKGFLNKTAGIARSYRPAI